MPVEACQVDGKPGRRWGDRGKCYTFGEGTGRTEEDAEALALRQGRAVEANKGTPLLTLAQGLEHRVVTALGIKATPPTYRRQVATIADVLSQQWGDDLEGALQQGVADLAALQDVPGRARPAAARRVIEAVAEDLGARGRELPAKVVDEIGRTLAAAYRLGVDEVAQPLGWSIDFQLPDADAVAGLHDSGLFWIGNFYRNHLTDRTLPEVVERELIKGGRSREETGRALRTALERWSGPRSDAYWQGLAATVATRARSFGALSAMQEAGAVTYEYVNPLDERTSDVCRALDGTTFTIKGSVELRERFLRAGDPEQVKAIAPWPRVADLQGVDGNLLSAAELQAKGIAWPPLHFHCRSSIDVATWGPMPDEADALGDVDVGQRVRPPAAGKPSPTAPSKPGAVPTLGTPWESAKSALDKAVAGAKRAGLAADRFTLSQDTREAVRRHLLAQAQAQGTFTRRALLLATETASSPRPTHRSVVVELVEALAPGSPTADKALVERVSRELELLDAITVAYRDAVKTAPPSWIDAERRRWTSALLGKATPSGWTRKDRDLVAERWHDALAMWDADLLRLLVTEGEQFTHNGRNLRGFASPGRPGGVTINLGKLLGERVNAWDWQVVSHEWHHRLDALLGRPGTGSNLGACGHAWRARPGYDDLPKLWADTFRDPFDAAKTPGLDIVKSTTKLPHESEPVGRYYWTGTWADPYEARIYSPGKPAKPELLNPTMAGPIEYIAQAATYHAQHTQVLVRDVLRRPSVTRAAAGLLPPTARTPHKVQGVAASALERVVGSADAAKYRTAVRLYGEGYRDGLEALHGGGARLLQQFADSPDLAWNGDGDVVLTALIFRHRYGVPLERSLGATGILRRHLTDPDVDLKALDKLVPATDADPEAEWTAWWDLLTELVRDQAVPR